MAGSGLSPGDVWAVGGRVVAHWNGHRWSRTSLAALLPHKPGRRPHLVDIYEESPSSVWAAGSGFRDEGGGPLMILHFDGHAWSKAAQAGAGNLRQIAPDGSGGLWIAVPTSDGQDGSTGEIAHLSGGRLTEAPLPVGPDEISIGAVANAPGTTRSFAAGFTHDRTDLNFDVHAVLLQIN